jgi:hypothetical protein
MNIYQRLIENPLFFKWIFHPTEELNTYWASYLEQNSGEKDSVLEFKTQFEKYLKFQNKQISERDKKRLAYSIIKQLEKVDQKNKRVLFFKGMLKYAAVALLFFSIGSSLVYVYMAGRQTEFVVESSVVPANVQEPVLIIDNNKQVQLNQGQSELDYSKPDEIIVNSEESIKRKERRNVPEMNTLVIPYGNRSFVTLSDGSQVWLNAGSRLIYPSEFVDKKREVLLVGEAFFKVAKQDNHPFIVKTLDIEIKVLGTSFNVSAYPEDYSVQTALIEGSVEMYETNAGLFNKKIKLSPGELAYFNKKNKETTIHKVDVEYYTLWTQGLLRFSNTDLSRITKKLERFYNIRFQFDDPLKGVIRVTGKLDVTKDKEEVLDYLSNLTGLDFMKINGNNYVVR